MLRSRHLLPLLFLIISCSSKAPPTTPATPAPRGDRTGTVTITVLGTNDLHGAVLAKNGKGGLALFASYVASVRKARAADGGGVLLVDAGDMFQGTVVSNLSEGAVVIAAYDAIGYDAAAIGNHEFDFGPVGDAVVAKNAGDDSFGALRARAGEATFPLLAANTIDGATGQPIAWANVKPSVMVEKARVKIGVIGVATEAALRTTMAANVKTLRMAPVADTIVAQAAALRKQGAQVVVVAAHAGGKCKDLKDASDVASCDPDQEIMDVAAKLPAGTVDVIVGGHTHAGMAQVVNGVPIVEAFASGKAFARVDLTVDRASGKVAAKIRPPEDIVAGATYEGAKIAPDAKIEDILAPAVARAKALEEKSLGVTLDDKIDKDFDRESAEGNLFCDLMLAARPQAQVAITNGGGLRADLPAGALTYGALYEAMPFDNRFALVKLTGRELAALIADNLRRTDGILSIAGTTASARCERGKLIVTTGIADDTQIVVVTSDFLATGGDFTKLPADRVTIEDGAPIREELAALLTKRGGHVRAADEFDKHKPRITYDGTRPIHCEK